MGILASVIVNHLRLLGDRLIAFQGGRPRWHAPAQVGDFLPEYDAPPQPARVVTVRDMIALFRQQTILRKGTVVTPIKD